MTEFSADIAIAMIRLTARRLAEAADELSRLDAVAGDGDHGVNMAAAFAEAEARIERASPARADDVFMLVGTVFAEIGGGSAGALFGELFAVLGRSLRGLVSPGTDDFVAGLELASRRVVAIGGAAAGDKTMLDALLPAVEVARARADAGDRAEVVLTAAAAAAAGGADATIAMRAGAGRAKYSTTGGLGTRDPGAVTVAIMFGACADALTSGNHHGRILAESALATRLDKLATDRGQFAILALDHVRSFATTVRPQAPDSLTQDEMRTYKGRLIEGLASNASAILLDPAQAVAQVEAASPAVGVGLIVGIEDGDYEAAAASPRLLPGWSVERAARLGADAVKISVHFNANEDMSVAERFVRATVRECQMVSLPLFCEPLIQAHGAFATRQLVLEGIRRFGSLGADVLKIQFPSDTSADRSRESWVDACGEADALCTTPWALLSEGREFGEFLELLTIACRAGASGFVAGRAIWGSVVDEPNTIHESSRRLAQLRSVAVNEGKPWRDAGRSPSDGAPRKARWTLGGAETEEVTGQGA